ncbi:MAG: EAL domain-containing protein [Methylococcaceae bacterium]|nr:EAL domain-containing protein [Methylococcaceae bacterium]
MLGTLRSQLMVGITLTVGLMMALFIWSITYQQQTEETNQHIQRIQALADSLATLSSISVASRDFSGLQEIVKSISHFPNLNHAIVLDLRGQVLAHSDSSKIGLYLNDLPRKPEFNRLQLTKNKIDVTQPIIFTEEKIGWVMIELDRTFHHANLAKIWENGLLYALVAIIFSGFITALASRYLTRRLYLIQQVADQVQAGANLRVTMSGNDEAAKLARQFNSMLDSLAQREQQLASFYLLDLVGLTITSPDKAWIRTNECLCKMLEYSEQELREMTWAQLTHPDDLCSDEEQFTRLLANEIEGYSLEKRFISRTGKVIPTQLVVRCARKDNGEVDYVMSMVEDISQRKADAEKIKQLAFYDPLTKLANRRLLQDRLHQALVSSARNGHGGALLFLDLDNFKTLNDSLGHDMGDILLQQVAERLNACIRKGDTVSRFGGDEFVVLLENLSVQPFKAVKQAGDIANKILSSLNQSYQLASHQYSSSTSIGIVLFKDNQSNEDELLKQADIAMYQAKNSGRNALRFFDPEMQASLTARVTLEKELKLAVKNQQFQLYYQIQVDSSQRPLGAETVIRWVHPERGVISPFHFIAFAEETGSILEIGQWVLNSACAQLKWWQKKDRTRELTLSVNVSAKQFHQVDFVDKVRSTVLLHGINPKLLKLELTESLLLNNIEDVIEKMTNLTEIGIQFSLDDFGTGYSSLQYLKRLPLYQLKIDQSFVRDIVSDENDRKIIRTIISMAKSMDLNLIAEGVETEQQQALLLSEGCTHFQGHLYSMPVPINEFEVLL